MTTTATPDLTMAELAARLVALGFCKRATNVWSVRYGHEISVDGGNYHYSRREAESIIAKLAEAL